jgi:hypothetical protein
LGSTSQFFHHLCATVECICGRAVLESLFLRYWDLCALDALCSLAHLEAKITNHVRSHVHVMEAQAIPRRHTEEGSPSGSSLWKLHRHSYDRRGCSTHTTRRSVSANVRLLLLTFDRLEYSYLFLAFCFIEVILLYAGLRVSIGHVQCYRCRQSYFEWHMLVGGMEDRISRLVQGSGLVAYQLAFREMLQMIVTILLAC